jgi:hypothetical protein
VNPLRTIFGHDGHDHEPTPERFQLRPVGEADADGWRTYEKRPVPSPSEGHGIPYPDDEHVHPGDPSKHGEHTAALRLTRLHGEEDCVAVQSGDWHDPATWWKGRKPFDGARVWNPAGKLLAGAGDLGRLKWLRSDGGLHLLGDFRLALETLVTTPGGVLRIGDVRGEIMFTDRGERDLAYDPFDLSCGLILHGTTDIRAAYPTVGARPERVPKAGDNVLWFGFDTLVPEDWQEGDEIDVVGCDPHFSPLLELDKTERRTIRAIHGDRTRLLIDPLENSFHGGVEDYQQALPVLNVTRRLVFRAENPETSRAHLMQMHNPNCRIEGVRFEGFGRTDVMRPHTDMILQGEEWVPSPGEPNQRGRYPIHGHGVTNAVRSLPPMVFKGNVIDGAPKHGIALHGVHAHAIDNVIRGAKGSGIFTENGTEVYKIVGNYVGGSVNAADARNESRVKLPGDIAGDTGGDGNAIWLNGGNGECEANLGWACLVGINLFPVPLGGGEPDQVLTANLRPEDVEPVGMGRESVHIQEVPGRILDNEMYGCQEQIQTYNSNLNDRENTGRTLIKGNRCYQGRLGMPRAYSRNLDIEENYFGGLSYDGKPHVTAWLTRENPETHNTNWRNNTFAYWYSGIRTDPSGDSLITGNRFVKVHYPVVVFQANGELVIEGNDWGDLVEGKPVNLQWWWERQPVGKFAPSVLAPLRIVVDGQRVYPNAQLPTSPTWGGKAAGFAIPEELAGLTNAETFGRLGRTFGGSLPPEDLEPHPLVEGGFAGPEVPYDRSGLLQSVYGRVYGWWREGQHGDILVGDE